jgi:2,3-bisphosphoglycerate-independent phosphoglycerate mutase
MKHKVILIIRDGWGYRKDCTDNAICQTPTPNTDSLMKQYPNVLLAAAGEAVGLPDGYQGNSEVGHMTIGSGRVIFQPMAQINKSIKEGWFFKIPELVEAVEKCKRKGTRLHLMGLFQTEGVHAHEEHAFAVIDLCRRLGFNDVLIHIFTDGRDAPVHDSLKHIPRLLEVMRSSGVGKIASVSGRYFAMDRNKNWDRTKKAYDCIVYARTDQRFDDILKYVGGCHAKEETDEFIVPAKANWYDGVREGDSMVFFNFRTDRTRQLTQAIVDEKFDGWARKPIRVEYVCMTQFYSPMNAKVAFKDQSLDNLLGQMVAGANLKQLRISETEKYAHVTFFFNGQVEVPNTGEDRVLIESPKVATFEMAPQMSLHPVTERLKAEIASKKYDLIVTNFVNCDLVGHTGIVEAIKQAVATVDECVGQTVKAGLANGYTLIVFADHGNAEDQTPEWRTSHTINPVPCILISDDPKLKTAKLRQGRGLQDIAPTVLGLMGLQKPKEMTGESLIE